MKTAFIGLDYIVDIMHSSGKVASLAEQAGHRRVIDKANTALEIARRRSWLTVLVKVGFCPGYYELPRSSPMFGRAEEFAALEIGNPGTDFHPELRADLADYVLVKPRINAFYGTPLEPLLRAQKVERIVVSGVSTTWAVQALARDAHDRDYHVAILEEGCAALTEQEHLASMEMMRGISHIVRLDELDVF